MNEMDKEQIKSLLSTLTQVSYTALTEVYRLKNDLTDARKEELKGYQNNLEMRIEELFT